MRVLYFSFTYFWLLYFSYVKLPFGSLDFVRLLELFVLTSGACAQDYPLMSALILLSDNYKISVISVLASVDYLF